MISSGTPCALPRRKKTPPGRARWVRGGRGGPDSPGAGGLGDARGERAGGPTPSRETSPPAPASTPPVAGSRDRGTQRWGNEGDDHHNLTPDNLRPPSPEKNAPGPKWRPRAAPEPETEVSEMLGGGDPDAQEPCPAPAFGRRESRPCVRIRGDGRRVLSRLSPAGPAGPEPEGGSGMLVVGDRVREPTRPPIHAPGPGESRPRRARRLRSRRGARR